VEVAVALPVLVLVLIGTIDFGRVFHVAIQLNNAARAGAQYGAQNVGTSVDTATMETIAMNAAGPGVSDITAMASRTCLCWSDDGASSSAPSPNTCTGTCVSPYHMVVTVTVVASRPFTMVASLPGIPRTQTITRTARMRVQ
jgi:Flp pilus assembly protein TadG